MKKRTKFRLILAAIVIVLVGGWVALVSSARLSMEEIIQKIEPQMQARLEYFEEKYNCQGQTETLIDYSDLEVWWQPYSRDHGEFMMRGRIVGDLTALIDSPAAYPYLEKESYSPDDLRTLHVMALSFSNGAQTPLGFDIENYDSFFYLDTSDVVFFDSQDNSYHIFYENDKDCSIYKNGEKVFSVKPPRPGACPLCNGSGNVRYYVGSSDWEAYLMGYDPYTIGPCPTCDGTGKVKQE